MPSTNDEYRNVLMEDECFDALASIGYTGNPCAEKLENRHQILK